MVVPVRLAADISYDCGIYTYNSYDFKSKQWNTIHSRRLALYVDGLIRTSGKLVIEYRHGFI